MSVRPRFTTDFRRFCVFGVLCFAATVNLSTSAARAQSSVANNTILTPDAKTFRLMDSPKATAIAENSSAGDQTSNDFSNVSTPSQLLESMTRLSVDAREMLKQLDLIPLLEQTLDLKRRVEISGSAKTLEEVILRQDLQDKRREVARIILKANLEVDYVLAAIDGEINQYSERIAELAMKRDKAVWKTTILSQWSNGLLWCGSSAFTVASVKTPTLSYPDGILGILAGAIPTVLSLYAMHLSHGEKVNAVVRPNMLSPLLTQQTETQFFPKSVVAYLNFPSSEVQGQTRRQALIERWIKDKYFEHDNSQESKRLIGLLAANQSEKKAVDIELLQTRQRMLDDLRTEVFKMKRTLLEIMEWVD